MLPSVSVIMAAYNGEHHVREAVDSILGQSLGNLELIVVDDASTDATSRVLARCRDSRLRVLHNPSRLGAAAARNRAIQIARAPLIAIQDADDVSFPQRLQTQTQFLARNGSVDLVGAWAVSMSDDGQRIGLLNYPPTTDLAIKWALLFWNPFIHSSVMLRRSTLEQAGFYHEGRGPAWFVEDYELFSRISRTHQAANIGEALVKYRVHPAGTSARYADLQRFSEEVSTSNVNWLLGGSRIDVETVQALRRFWFEGKSLWAADARRALAYNKRLQPAFLARYVEHRARRIPRARFYLGCARRALVQARNNSHLDRSCRAAMLLSTLSLAARAVA
jgi:glycosyltransferase involved in cell wall biosynthesis